MPDGFVQKRGCGLDFPSYPVRPARSRADDGGSRPHGRPAGARPTSTTGTCPGYTATWWPGWATRPKRRTSPRRSSSRCSAPSASFRWRDVPFSSWIFRIAHNCIATHYRKSAQRGGVTSELSGGHGGRPARLATPVEERITIDEVRRAAASAARGAARGDRAAICRRAVDRGYGEGAGQTRREYQGAAA